MQRAVCLSLLLFLAGSELFGAGPSFTPFEAARPVLEAHRAELPAALKNPNEATWLTWTDREDRAIRARLEQGDLDSMVNLLLFGTSFTTEPRIAVEHLTEASKSGLLRKRVDDLVSGVRNPGENERLIFLQHVLRDHGIDPENSPKDTGVFIYKNLLRILEERKTLAARASERSSLLDRASLFQDRGLSLDTGIIPAFTIEQTLVDLKNRGLLRSGQIFRVAVVGPGLDFIDKTEASAYDYYPEQMVQPFAVYDSLIRLGLAGDSLSLSILDISPRVLAHVSRARERAAKNQGYVIQLPQDIGRPWPPDLVSYWKSFGDRIGRSVTPIRPPAIFPSLQTRAIEIPATIALHSQPVDLDIVLERLPAANFDLIVATNIFVYYDAFEQSLSLENAGAMLKPGGFLLTNDRLPEVSGGSMRLAGTTVVPLSGNADLPVGWYRRQ